MLDTWALYNDGKLTETRCIHASNIHRRME